MNSEISKKSIKGLVSVGLHNWSVNDPIATASHAAQTCYKATLPDPSDAPLNVEKQLFDPGHHTTLEHTSFSFEIEGISVGGVTFGLHLCHPFYNTDQRSGRFCAKMFADPNYDYFRIFLETYYKEVPSAVKNEILLHICKSVSVYQNQLPLAESFVVKHFAETRPFASETVRKNIPKIAQEQMRMFIPVMFPTALTYTIDFITLVSLWTSAWTPEMITITDMMRDLVLEKWPALSFAFCNRKRVGLDYGPALAKSASQIAHEPSWQEIVSSVDDVESPHPEHTHPVDLLHFHPKYMKNSTSILKAKVAISVATMGQDQRHRTFSRSDPVFTGCFYLAPILQELKLDEEAEEIMWNWIRLRDLVPSSLGAVLAPYGAMVTYNKVGNLNAFAHEQAKRLCWSAQEEIYEVSRQARSHLQKVNHGIERLMIPPCYVTGKCAEGNRYCGRDLGQRVNVDFFPKRRI